MRSFLFGGADELQSAASRWCRSLNGAVARVERAVRYSPGLRCFLNVRVAPWAGLAGTTAQPNVDARSGGGARCVPSANPSVARVRERVRWKISWSPAPKACHGVRRRFSGLPVIQEVREPFRNGISVRGICSVAGEWGARAMTQDRDIGHTSTFA